MPYVVWLDGIGWRNDKIGNDIAGMKVPWDIFWESKPWTGKVGILDDQRDALAMPMQRDAMRVGRIPDLNTEDPAIIAKAGRDLSQLTSISNIKVDITDYQTLPEGKSWLHHAWSGDLLAAALYYLPKGTKPDVLSFWGPDAGRRRAERPALGARRKSKKPVLAHAFLNFMLDKKNAYDNFVQFNGYTPPQNTIDARLAGQAGPDPEEPRAAPFCGPTSSRTTRSCSRSASRARKLWQNAWAKFKAG